jgi:hypothetical protein
VGRFNTEGSVTRPHAALVAQPTTGGSIGSDTPAPTPPAPEPATRLLQIGITRQTHQSLLDHQAGKTGRPTRDAVLKFVMNVAAATTGKKMPPVVSGYPITLVLTACLRAALRRLHDSADYEFSDAAIAAVFAQINRVAH